MDHEPEAIVHQVAATPTLIPDNLIQGNSKMLRKQLNKKIYKQEAIKQKQKQKKAKVCSQKHTSKNENLVLTCRERKGILFIHTQNN